MSDPDDDLKTMSPQQLADEVRRLRKGIRGHRDSSGHALCWFHPQLWTLLPETTKHNVVVPEWPQFLRGCLKFRESLDRELPDAPRTNIEFKD